MDSNNDNKAEDGEASTIATTSTTSTLSAIPLPVIAVAASAVVLPILYRLGIGTSILVVVLAVTVNAVPEARQILDSFFGRTPVGRHRLTSHDAVNPLLARHGREQGPPLTAAGYEQDGEERFVELDVGPVMQDPLSRLIDLIQRDFIDYWYSSSVALSSSTSFPKHTRSLLNVTMNNLVSRVKRQDPKEVSIYLFHSASNALIGEVREGREGRRNGPRGGRKNEAREKEELIRKVRRTSEELMLTLAPRSATSSPLVLSLLAEILSLEIWSTIQSLNSDFINSTIVSSLGDAVNIAKEVQKKAKAAEAANSDSLEIMQGHGFVVDGSATGTVLEKMVDGRKMPVDPVAEVQRTAFVPDQPTPSTQLPPLPPRPKQTQHQQQQQQQQQSSPIVPAHTISLSSPDHTFAASAGFGFVPPVESYSPRKSVDAGRTPTSTSATNPSSTPSSPTTTRHTAGSSAASTAASPHTTTKLGDKTLEEAVDQGTAKLKAFGKNLFSASQRLLDAALPLDEQGASTAGEGNGTGYGGRRKSLSASAQGLAGVIMGAGNGSTGTSSRGSSIKGKERERISDDAGDASPQGASSPTTGRSRPSSPTNSMRSPPMAAAPSSSSRRSTTSSSRPPSTSIASPPSSRPSSMMLFSPSATTSPLPGTTTATQPAAPLAPPQVRLQKALDILKTSDVDRRSALIKQMERSLFSKDLSLLFPAPRDDQLRAVLARHTSSGEIVDPSLIEMSDDFHEYLEKDTSGTGEKLLRLWTQLDHFGYMVDLTKPSEVQLQEDSLNLFQKIFSQCNELETLAGPGGEEEKSYITACEMTILRMEQNPNREIFEPLQDWLLRCIQERYWDRFVRGEGGGEDQDRGGKGAGNLDIMQRPLVERVPSASTSRRTLDSIPGHGTPRDGDGDIGMSMHEPEEVSDKIQPGSSSQGRHQRDESASSAGAIAAAADANEDEDSQQNPAFSVSVTDLSAPTAYHNNHVKNRKELEFLIAVEVEGSPGYILARKYIEFEKMDQGIKKALPQSGTKSFPRAPLPSTNFQTSENLCHSLEQYLEALLHDDRYASSEPVVLFFAKERTDSKGGPVQPLAFLGRRVNAVGKGVTEVTRGIGKGGEFAGKSLATGFNTFTSAVTTLPGLKRTTSSGGENANMVGSPASAGRNLKRMSSGTLSPSESRESLSMAEGAATLKSPSVASLPITIAEDQEPAPAPVLATESEKSTSKAAPPLPPRPSSPLGYEVPVAPELPPRNLPVKAVGTEPTMPETPPGFHYTPRKKVPLATERASKSSPSSPTRTPAALPEVPVAELPSSPILGGRMSFDEFVQKDQELLKKQAEEIARLVPPPSSSVGMKMEKSSSEPGVATARAVSPLPTAVPASMTAMEFNNVLSFAMAILEEAYELADSTWNIKRGILKVLETLLRTSYASVIKAAVTKLVTTASDETFYAGNLDKLRESFWPPPENIWWSSLLGSKQPERTLAEKEATRIEARRLMLLQAPEGLKVTLGSSATADAFGRLHDSLQGQGAERLVSTLVLDYLRLLLL